MVSLTQWIWVWASSGSWRWTGKPEVLQSMGSQRVWHYWVTELNWLLFCGFPGSSAGKESACNAGDLSLIPGSGRSPSEGKGYPLQYSWVSLVVQTVKNLPAMRERHGNPLQYSCLENPMDRGAWWVTVHRVMKCKTRLNNWAHTWTHLSCSAACS